MLAREIVLKLRWNIWAMAACLPTLGRNYCRSRRAWRGAKRSVDRPKVRASALRPSILLIREVNCRTDLPGVKLMSQSRPPDPSAPTQAVGQPTPPQASDA